MTMRFSHSFFSLSSGADFLVSEACGHDYFWIVVGEKGSGKKIAEANKFLEHLIAQRKVLGASFVTHKAGAFLKSLPLRAAVVGILEQSVLHVTTVKGYCLLMIRQGKVGVIARPNAGVKGDVKEDDVLVCVSEPFADRVSQETFIQIGGLADPKGSARLLREGTSRHSDTIVPSGLVVRIVSSRETQNDTPRTLVIPKTVIAQFLGKIRQATLPTRLRAPLSYAKRKRKHITAITILVILFAVSIIFQTKRNERQKRQEKVTQALQVVVQQYDEATSLLDLNPVRSRQLLASAKDELGEMMATFPKDSPEYEEVSGWVQKITTSQVAANKIFTYPQAQLFFDITLIRQQGEGRHIAEFKNVAAILDEKNHALYGLDLLSKKSQILAGPDTVKDASSVSVHGTTAYLATSEGVVAVDASDKNTKTVLPKDDEWKRIASLVSFAGNLYLLDTGTPTIWKYQSTEDGFSGRIRYIDAADGSPLADATGMVIDGFVWIVTPSGIRKYASGAPVAFTVTGLDDGIGSFDVLYTSDEVKQLYILDKSKSRIVVLDKDGAYHSQYQWEGLREADDFLVQEIEKKIFILSKNMIYTLDLKE